VNKLQLKNIIKKLIKEQGGPCATACANPNSRSITAVDCLSGNGAAHWLCAMVDGGQVPQLGQVVTGFGMINQPNGPAIPAAYKITNVQPSGTFGSGCPDNPTINNGSTTGDCGYECSQSPNYSCSPNYTSQAQYSSVNDCLNNCDCTNDPVSILGCTNSTACNYDPNATCDDGSCCVPNDPTCNGCTDPTATNYDPNAVCDDGSCTFPTAACQSGAFPTFGFMDGCNASSEYFNWPGYYNPPAGGASTFTWFGGQFTDPNGTVINNGGMYSSAMVNMVLANQGSYCEWCDDFANNGVNYGGAGMSPQFNDWLPLWHDATPLGGPWSQTTGITPPEIHCCCCPGQGGGPMNPGATLSAKMGGSDDDLGIDLSDLPKDEICCNWCATVNPNIPSKPPVGCEDWMCDECPDFKPFTPTLTESFKRALQKRAGIIK